MVFRDFRTQSRFMRPSSADLASLAAG